MTTRPGDSPHKLGGLKVLLAVGSIAASLLGAQLVAIKDAAVAAASSPSTMLFPKAPQVVAAPDTGFDISSLPPVPTALVPVPVERVVIVVNPPPASRQSAPSAPVTQTRSSR